MTATNDESSKIIGIFMNLSSKNQTNLNRVTRRTQSIHNGPTQLLISDSLILGRETFCLMSMK